MESLKNLDFRYDDDFMVLRRFESVDPPEHAKPKAILNRQLTNRVSKLFKKWVVMQNNRYPTRTKDLQPFHYMSCCTVQDQVHRGHRNTNTQTELIGRYNWVNIDSKYSRGECMFLRIQEQASWREGLAVKSMYYSCRGPRVNSQHPHFGSHLLVAAVLGDPKACRVDTHTCRRNIIHTTYRRLSP